MPRTQPSNRRRVRSLPSTPKRSESSTAIGRAPIAKMSRRMPPTPVAAPWNGSTALGWLCDSTLNATARPSPTSTAPAFSPGPMTTCSPSVGSVPSSFLECLYEQCSLHRRENIASSTSLGSRPSFSTMSAYSDWVRPRSSALPRPGTVSDGDTGGALEQLQAVGGAQQRVDRVLGMRHEPDDVAALVADARDVVRRPVGVAVVGVAQHDLAGVLQAARAGREEAPRRVLDGDREDLARLAGGGEGGVGPLDDDADLTADEPQPHVRQQRAGQHPGLAQDLEAVADPEHRAAVAREGHDGLHDGREAGDRADAQVVAVGEPAWDHDRVGAAEVAVAVPEDLRVADLRAGEQRVRVVAGPREADDAEPHRGATSSPPATSPCDVAN